MNKYLNTLAMLAMLSTPILAFAQAKPDDNVPTLTLEQKITLTTDDVKMQDALERAQAAYMKERAPIFEHQNAAKKVMEDEHPGWQLESGPQGWHYSKKPEPPKPEAKKTDPPKADSAKK